MNAYILGILVGLAAIVMIAAIRKWRTRNRPMSVAEKADDLSWRRARMLPALAVIFLSQQATFFSQMTGGEHVAAANAKISAWLVLSVLMLFGLSTKGFWLESKEVRNLVDDENTQANRNDAMRWGFLFGMASAIGVYVLAMFEPVSGREAVHIVLSFGIAAALLRWAVLEKRAHRDA
jgi:hypothetical protein